MVAQAGGGPCLHGHTAHREAAGPRWRRMRVSATAPGGLGSPLRSLPPAGTQVLVQCGGAAPSPTVAPRARRPHGRHGPLQCGRAPGGTALVSPVWRPDCLGVPPVRHARGRWAGVGAGGGRPRLHCHTTLQEVVGSARDGCGYWRLRDHGRRRRALEPAQYLGSCGSHTP